VICLFDRSVFDEIEARLNTLEIDDIKKRLEPLMLGYAVQSPIFDPGAFVYRGRVITPTFNKATGITRKDLIYPPTNLASLGRLNRAGQPVFYCSTHKESVFFELPDLKPGDEVVLTFWKTTEKMFVNNIGYTEYAFKELGAKRPVPQWGPIQAPDSTKATVTLPEIPEQVRDVALSKDQNRELKEAFSKRFMCKVGDGETFLYRLTVAIGEIHLGTIVSHKTQFAGILYPSVRMWANGDNVALLPWFVDSHLDFRKAVHVGIKGRTETSIDTEYLDAAHEFDDAGNLKWLGRVRAWPLEPKQGAKFAIVAGLDEDGDYTIVKDGQPAHWTAEDVANQLPEKLKAEWPGILQWQIDGCLEWQRHGLAAPQAVTSATADYLEAQDTLAAWIEECIEEDPKAWESRAALFESWSNWASAASEHIGTRATFLGKLERRFEPQRQAGTGSRGFRGLRLKRPAQQAPYWDC
jgi:hypothetical protein